MSENEPGGLAGQFGKSQGSSDNVWEVLYTTRAIRRFKPDPIPDEIVRRLVDAAIRAPSGSNRQTWRFLFVRDAETKRKMAAFAEGALGPVIDPSYARAVAGENATPEQLAAVARIQRSVVYLKDHFAEVPLVLVPCLAMDGARATATSGSSIYPAMWNLQLAARALGIGSVLTTINRHRQDEFKALLGIPDGVETFACVPLGYPQGYFGVGPRQPAASVTYMDRWGEALA